MNCRTLRKRTSLYFDGRLARGDAAAFEQHLASCGSCQQEFSKLEASLRTLNALPHLEVPSGGRDRLFAAIAGNAPGKRAPLFVWKPASAVAAVVVGLACAALLFQAGMEPAGKPGSPVAERIEAPAPSPEQPTAVHEQTTGTREQTLGLQARYAPAVTAAGPKAPLRQAASVSPGRRPARRMAQAPKVRQDAGGLVEAVPAPRIAREPDPESAEPSEEPRDLSASTAQMVSEGLGPLVAAAQVEEDSLEWISDIEVEDWL